MSQTTFHTLMDAIKNGSASISEVYYNDNYDKYYDDDYNPRDDVQGSYVDVLRTSITYTFTLHQHPFAQQLVAALLAGGVRGLQAKDTEYRRKDPDSPEEFQFYQVPH